MEHHKISTSDMIHTNVEGLFQQLLTAFVAATGKSHWSTTSERDQTSCHNGTSASTLASCVNFIRDVITSSRPDEVIEALLKPRKHQKHSNVPSIAKTISDIVTSLMHNPWDLFSLLGTSSQHVARPTSNSLPEPTGTIAAVSPG